MNQELEEIRENEVVPPKILQHALNFGLVKVGYNLEDYLREAVKTEGYETICIWGKQGAGKSSLALQMAFWLLGDWEKVLSSVVFRPGEFVERLQAIPEGKRVPVLIWDDISVHFPSSKFKTDIKMYESIDSCWAAIRTKVNVIILTTPLISRLGRCIRDNVSLEIFVGANQVKLIERIVRLPDLKDVGANIFKIALEKPRGFDLYATPLQYWVRYEKRRHQLTSETIDMLGSVTNPEDTEGYTEALDLALELGISPTSLYQMRSAGIVKGRKMNDVLYIDNEYIPKLRQVYLSKRVESSIKKTYRED